MMINNPCNMGMDYTVQFYNHFASNSQFINCDKKCSLLACEMVLKDKFLDSSAHFRALNFIFGLAKSETLTDNDWTFVIDCTRKGVKRLDKTLENLELIDKLLLIISEHAVDKLKNVDQLLKLFLTCQDCGLKLNDILKEFLDSLYSFDILELDFDEFHFIACPKREQYMKQRCQRLLLLINPLKGLLTCPEASDNYWFGLFSISDSELISFMKRLLQADEKRFLKFYNHVIVDDLLSVDFFIDQLLTDSVDLLELLLEITGLTIVHKMSKHFKNFHMLLLLKLEISSETFPFNCEILVKKMEIFLKKI